MKIYFAFTMRGDRSRLAIARKIVQLLEHNGHTVLTKHLFDEDAPRNDDMLTPEQVFARDVEWLRQSDAVIVDASGSSFGIGFETGFALGSMDKKVFLIYEKGAEDKISRMATGLVHKNCVKYSYVDVQDLSHFIETHFPRTARISGSLSS